MKEAHDRVGKFTSESDIPVANKKELKLTLISFSENIESSYFWVLDFLADKGWKMAKTHETMSASEASSFFGEMGGRKTAMEDRAQRSMTTINAVIRSVIKLLYDLKQFDERLELFGVKGIKSENPEDKSSADLALKRVWMDEVDVRKGMASINQLSAGKLEFITLRDAFLAAKSAVDVENMDLNDRVKRIVSARMKEYEIWKDKYKIDLEQRKAIEKAYLKSQVKGLELYTMWAKPYLKAVHKLKLQDFPDPDKEMKGIGESAEMISNFDQNFLELKILGTKEVYEKDIFKTMIFGADKLVKFSGKEEEMKGNKIILGISVDFKFRTRPVVVKAGPSQYRFLGKLEMVFKSYVFKPEEFEKLKKKSKEAEFELIDAMTEESLLPMKEDLDKYLEEKNEEPEKEVNTVFDSWNNWLNKLNKDKEKLLKQVGLAPKSKSKKSVKYYYTESKFVEESAKKVTDDNWSVYETYKKSHGMLTW